MASNSLEHWKTQRTQELNEIADAHAQVGGSGRGRRYATQQINHAYAMLLSSQFQGFCRDLHLEAVNHIVHCVTPLSLRAVLLAEFTLHRKLDRGNPTPTNIGSDFNRLGLLFWDRVRGQSQWNHGRISHLENLNAWRNAIAHQDFDSQKLGDRISLRLAQVRKWRDACEQLAIVFDSVVSGHIAQVTGKKPW